MLVVRRADNLHVVDEDRAAWRHCAIPEGYNLACGYGAGEGAEIILQLPPRVDEREGRRLREARAVVALAYKAYIQGAWRRRGILAGTETHGETVETNVELRQNSVGWQRGRVGTHDQRRAHASEALHIMSVRLGGACGTIQINGGIGQRVTTAHLRTAVEPWHRPAVRLSVVGKPCGRIDRECIVVDVARGAVAVEILAVGNGLGRTRGINSRNEDIAGVTHTAKSADIYIICGTIYKVIERSRGHIHQLGHIAAGTHAACAILQQPLRLVERRRPDKAAAVKSEVAYSQISRCNATNAADVNIVKTTVIACGASRVVPTKSYARALRKFHLNGLFQSRRAGMNVGNLDESTFTGSTRGGVCYITHSQIAVRRCAHAILEAHRRTLIIAQIKLRHDGKTLANLRRAAGV